MLISTDAQLNTLGKLYYWRYHLYRDDSWPTTKYLGTNDSVLAPLKQKSLIESPRPQYWRLTHMGKRVYELNYWLRRQKVEDRILTRIEKKVKKTAPSPMKTRPNYPFKSS